MTNILIYQVTVTSNPSLSPLWMQWPFLRENPFCFGQLAPRVHLHQLMFQISVIA